MQHPDFGEIDYAPAEQAWTGWIRLPLFAAYDASAVREANGAVLSRPEGVDPALRAQLAASGGNGSDQRFLQGEFPLFIEPPHTTAQGLGKLRQWWGGRGKPPREPGPAQVRAFYFLVEKEARVLEAVVQATYTLYSEEWRDFREDDGPYSREQWDLVLPRLDSPEGLKRLLKLTGVTLLGSEKHESAPVRFQFICPWDHEHGYELYAVRDQVSFQEP